MKKNSAFSLLELAIVVMIIGILIAGVTQSSRMVKEVRLKTAQSLTQSSPVNTISGLLLWYETSLESSFAKSESYDGATITTWYDNSPQSPSKNNATQSTSSYRPKFYEDAFNGSLPGVRFDGVNDYLGFDGSGLIGNSYTVFVVERVKESSSATNYFISGNQEGDDYTCLSFGYSGDSEITGETQDIILSNKSNGLFWRDMITIGETPTTRIHTGMVNSLVGKSYWYNGGLTAESSDTKTATLVAYETPAIGAFLSPSEDTGGHFYYGDIGEIIIFNRALDTDERRAVETYLGKKHNVKLS